MRLNLCIRCHNWRWEFTMWVTGWPNGATFYLLLWHGILHAVINRQIMLCLLPNCKILIEQCCTLEETFHKGRETRLSEKITEAWVVCVKRECLQLGSWAFLFVTHAWPLGECVEPKEGMAFLRGLCTLFSFLVNMSAFWLQGDRMDKERLGESGNWECLHW